MKFYEKSLILNYSTLYDIDFPQKNRFLRFFLRKFLLTVFHIIFGEFYFFYCPKFQIWIFMKNPWNSIIQHCTTLIFHKKFDFAIFFKKVSIDGFSHFSSKIHPKFSKNRLFHIPPIYYIFLIRILCSFQQSNY